MNNLQDDMHVLRKQLADGHVQRAYEGLLRYFNQLKRYFHNNHPEINTPGSVYYGYMDMTYFGLSNDFLKNRKLKIGIVFSYETFSFEGWLIGVNSDVREEYWEKMHAGRHEKYDYSSDPKREGFIIKQTLVSDPDFSD